MTSGGEQCCEVLRGCGSVVFPMPDLILNHQNLRALRTLRKWSLTDLANATGLSVGTLSRAERGERDLAYASIERVAEALAIPVGVILTLREVESMEAVG